MKKIFALTGAALLFLGLYYGNMMVEQYKADPKTQEKPAKSGIRKLFQKKKKQEETIDTTIYDHYINLKNHMLMENNEICYYNGDSIGTIIKINGGIKDTFYIFNTMSRPYCRPKSELEDRIRGPWKLEPDEIDIKVITDTMNIFFSNIPELFENVEEERINVYLVSNGHIISDTISETISDTVLNRDIPRIYKLDMGESIGHNDTAYTLRFVKN